MKVPKSNYYLNRGYGTKNSRNYKTTTIETIASTLVDLITPATEEATISNNLPNITIGEEMNNMTMNNGPNMDTMTNFTLPGNETGVMDMTNSTMNDFYINASMITENSNSDGNIITEMNTQASELFTQISDMFTTIFNNETMADNENETINGTVNHAHMHHVQDQSINPNSILYIILGVVLGVLVVVGTVIVVMYTQSKKRGFQEIAGVNKDRCDPEPQSMSQIEQQFEKTCLEETLIDPK